MSEPKVGDVVWWLEGGVGTVLGVDRLQVVMNNGDIVSVGAAVLNVATTEQRAYYKSLQANALKEMARLASQEFENEFQAN